MQKWISCCQPKPEAAQHQNHRHNNQAVAYFFHFLMLHSLDHFRRDATDHSVGRNILSHHSTRSYHRPITNGHSCGDGRIGANPDMLPQLDGCIMVFTALARIKVVVDCGQDHIVTNQAPIPSLNAPLILKMAAGIDENILTNTDIFPII